MLRDPSLRFSTVKVALSGWRGVVPLAMSELFCRSGVMVPCSCDGVRLYVYVFVSSWWLLPVTVIV